MQIQNDFIERVKREVTIESYISRFVTLKTQGKRALGLCPFHKEKSPSFTVSLVHQLFHCFGCGKSGDLITFVREYDRVDFRRSLEILSEYSGIPLETTENRGESQKKAAFFQLNSKFMEYFSSNLWGERGLEARQYLESRGISDSLAKKFHLGYALPGFDNFTRDLLGTPESIQNAQILGLVKTSPNRPGSVYDFYRERLIFPILDSNGKVLGFGGRLIRDSTEAKYINSPASPIYDKGKVFYGLDSAGQELRSQRVAILVEGYLDVIGLHSKDFFHTLAPLGTAFTVFQARFLKNLVDKVILMFDGDRAGRAAGLRATEICFRENLLSEVIFLENGVDPFDLAMSKTKIEIKEILGKTTSQSDFLLRENLLYADRSSSPEEKRRGINKLFSFIKSLDRDTDKQMYLSEGAKQLGISMSAIINDFKNERGVTFEAQKDDIKKKEIIVPDSWVAIQRKILALVILENSYLEDLNDLEELEFSDPDSSYLWEMIYTKYMNSEDISISILQDQEFPENVRSAIMPYIMEVGEESDPSENKQLFHGLCLLHQKKSKEHELKSLSNGVSVLDDTDRISRIISIRSEIFKLDEELRKSGSTMGRG
ncbi:MAG: DNA primase [Leptospiraceae bacterium]|nr:DNA primase [Leptospiraceae bacterium]MCP5510392.1 DNA primase [Leptospiraceae bacterium]